MKTDELRGRAERKEADLAEAQAKVEKLGAGALDLKKQLWHARNQCSEMGKSLDESNELREGLKKVWEFSEDEVKELKTELEERNAEVASLKEKLHTTSVQKEVRVSNRAFRVYA